MMQFKEGDFAYSEGLLVKVLRVWCDMSTGDWVDIQFVQSGEKRKVCPWSLKRCVPDNVFVASAV